MGFLRTATCPLPAQEVQACAKLGVGLAWDLGGRYPEEAQSQTPQILGCSPSHGKRPKPTPPRPVITARPGPRVPVRVPQLIQDAERDRCPGPVNDQALPCPASLWTRRSGPRPRTSLGDCGSWSSAQERVRPQTRTQRDWDARRPVTHTLRDQNRSAGADTVSGGGGGRV